MTLCAETNLFWSLWAPCAKISNLFNNMLSNRFFQVFFGNQSSRWCRLNNGLPQSSVLAPILFNQYMSDLPPWICSSMLTTSRWHIKQENLKNAKSLLFDQLPVVPPIRLWSRSVFWQLTLDPCKMATVSWTVGENHSCIMCRWMVTLWMTLPLLLLDLTWNVKNGSFWTDFTSHKASVRT
jgi:hypothetical protein